MALFDNINSRYTQSMAKGGTYQRDASIGGYSRKELRGLGKQAKSGTLTQRERARYEHLKGERKGRRKRGLLAGLGGAAVTVRWFSRSWKARRRWRRRWRFNGYVLKRLCGSGRKWFRWIAERIAALQKEGVENYKMSLEREEDLASAIEGSEDQETFSQMTWF